ncbi:efflux RND transporter permease subunit [Temperatibacter marinus]|uniref:Efflux RND transporter permease subunit n=1 Tax=Temperatibacter marinus TaxID=1456591 RepID=A0AA52HAY9_9PROT|nr:efflux RND transporter permease subunit [Temperatibacter marinus]WND03230.1 efflux RND transporter permease subunit [Temperatibacter marinus]
MSLSTKSLHNPVIVAAVTTLILVLGIVAIFNMPAQLLPNIQKPVITVVNSWPGASPTEMESEVTVKVEEVLRGTPGMTKMNTWNGNSFSYMQLEFSLGTNMTETLIDVISRINRMRPLPSNAQKPSVFMGEWGDANDSLIEYFIQHKPDSTFTLAENLRYLRSQFLPELQSLYGVSNVEFDDGTGGQKEQIQIIIDPYKAAELGVDIARINGRISGSADISSGVVNVGTKQYNIRIEGRYDIEELQDIIVDWRDEKPIRLKDLAAIKLSPAKASSFIMQNGNDAVRMTISKTNDANVLEAIQGVKDFFDTLEVTEFKKRGLTAQYSFDPSSYINRSISFLSMNLFIGIGLAICILYLFLRQWRATILISMAIPISLLATFFLFSITGRSLNIISLAGLAFATGMVLDAAIVVLENIVRFREKGERPFDASEKGAAEVWGALLASTATTVAIFIPIMFLEDVEGQMFADLALTLAISITTSLIVAVTILPTMARFWMRDNPPERNQALWEKISQLCMRLTRTNAHRVFWIAGLIFLSVGLTVFLWPKSNFLPPMNRDTIDNFVMFPPGISIENSKETIAKVIDKRLEPHLKGEKEPFINDYYFWSFGSGGGWLALNGKEGADLEAIKNFSQTQLMTGIPDMMGFAYQRSLFGGFGGNASIALNIKSKDMEESRAAALAATGMVFQMIPGAIARTEPDPSSDALELRFIPNDRRLAEVGWTRRDLMMVVLELGNGQWLGEYFDGSERLDIYMKTIRFNSPEEMQAIPVHTPFAGVVPIGDLASIEQVRTPSMIIRRDGSRVYSVTVNPPEGMPMETLLEELKTKIEPAIRPMLPPDAIIEYAGGAEDLARALSNLFSNLALAVLILFLLMAALFKSIKDSIFVVVSLPLASFGGVLMIYIMSMVSPLSLDLLGMIGFVILTGLVVNNAILLVAQTRASEAEGNSRTEAVQLALRRRIRPIFMSTLTSLFGMLPLLMFPGSGSEIYRAMAAAIVGGMTVSTLFTLLFLPSLLQLDFGLSSSKSKNTELAAGE